MSNDKEYDIDSLFEEEEKLLREESKKIEDLYSETKEHYDQVKNARKKKNNFNIGSSGSSDDDLNKKALPFIANQTANLNTIRKMKMDSINDMVKIKKEKMNLKLKIKQLGVDADKADNFAEIANSLLTVLSGKANKNIVSDAVLDTELLESDVERRIRELEAKESGEDIEELTPCVIEHKDGSVTYAFYDMVNDDVVINYDMDEAIMKLEIKYDDVSGDYLDIRGNIIDVFND